jgi:hypothetical protein
MLKQIVASLAILSLVFSEAVAQEAALPVSQNNQQGATVNQSGVVTVRKRTGIKFVTLQPIDSATARAGDDIPLQLAIPLMVDGITVLPAGTLVHSKVLKVKRADDCHDGNVKWKLDKITFPDGTTAKVIPYPIFRPKEWSWSDPDVGAALILAPPILALWGTVEVIRLPVLGVAHLLGTHLPSENCDTKGQQYYLPANTPVALMVTDDHRVKY